MEMDKEFVPYEEALALKALGFDEMCIGRYMATGTLFTYKEEDNNFLMRIGGTKENSEGYCTAPLYQQAFRWFREKYGMKFYIKQDNWNHWCTPMIHIPETDSHEDICDSYETYEEAELECLQKLIEIVGNKIG
jgi:hypothetical protein